MMSAHTKAWAPAVRVSPAPSTLEPRYPDVPLVATAGFGLYVVEWYLEFGERIPQLGAIRLEFILGALLAVFAVVSIAQRNESNQSRLTKYICTYFMFLLVSLPFSRYPSISSGVYVDHVLKLSCMTLFVYAFVRSPRTLAIFTATLLLAFAKIGQEALLGKITGSMVWQNQGIMRLNGHQGSMFGHPNSLSGLAVSTLPFLYYLFPVVTRKWEACLLLLFVFAVNMVIFTGSRTGYLGTLALVGFIWLRSARKARFLAIVLLIVAIGLPLIPDEYAGRFSSAFSGEEGEGHSKEERVEIAGEAWQLFPSNPQGLGIYAFRYARADLLGKNQMDTYNLYLQTLVDLGVLGVIVFGLLLFNIVRELYSTERSLTRQVSQLEEARQRGDPALDRDATEHLADLRFVRATAAAFLAYVFTRLVLGVFGHDLYEIYWWLSAGASIAILNMQPSMEARTAALLSRVLTVAQAVRRGIPDGVPVSRPTPTRAFRPR